MLFSYTTRVVMLGYSAESLEIGDLPIVPGDMRSTTIFSVMKAASERFKLRGRWRPKPGSGWELFYRLMRVNATTFTTQLCLVTVSAVLFYAPAFFLQKLVHYLETDTHRKNPEWGWVYCAGLFFSNAITYLSKPISFPRTTYAKILNLTYHSHWSTLVNLNDHASSQN